LKAKAAAAEKEKEAEDAKAKAAAQAQRDSGISPASPGATTNDLAGGFTSHDRIEREESGEGNGRLRNRF